MNNLYPQPTEDFEKAQNDLKLWGYCLLLNAIPKNLNEDAKKRLEEQAEAEKKLNIAYQDGSQNTKWGEFNEKKLNNKEEGINQRVWMLPNKGKEFLQILDHHKYFQGCYRPQQN